MPDLEKTYDDLVDALKRRHLISTVHALLGWDEQVLLPPGSTDLRADQLALLADIEHEATRRPEIGEWLTLLEGKNDSLSPDQAAVVRDARRDFDRATRLPAEFVRRKTKAQSRGYHTWVQAREQNDFMKFAPCLEEHLNLAQEEAAFMNAANAYDYWIDVFDPGMNQATIQSLFTPLLPELRKLVDLVEHSPVRPPADALRGFPEAAQASFGTEVAKALGFDFNRGRIDQSIHPFCGGETRDTRITTRYDPNDPLESLFSVIHESGHGMYEQSLPHEHLGTALGSSVGMAVHESQSRLWENQVGRSRAFWKQWESRYRQLFPEQLASLSSDELYLAINRVAVSPIRVSADEVTYNLHIMLRFELEQKLFRGDFAPRDLPEVWNAESERILGLRPASNREGCLQDVHWSCGLFGYFPSYCLGNLIAAQWWECIRGELTDLDEQIAVGDYAPLLDWLRKRIHSLGRRYRTGELVERVTGKPLSHEPLVRYLNNRLQPLYR